MDNGFGRFTDDDKVIYNKSPKWTGGLNNSFTYKDWNFSFFTYFRFGNTYYGLSQTIGRRLERMFGVLLIQMLNLHSLLQQHVHQLMMVHGIIQKGIWY